MNLTKSQINIEIEAVLFQIEERISSTARDSASNRRLSISDAETLAIVERFTDKLKQISSLPDLEKIKMDFLKAAKSFANEYTAFENNLAEIHEKHMSDDPQKNWKKHSKILKAMRDQKPCIAKFSL